MMGKAREDLPEPEPEGCDEEGKKFLEALSLFAVPDFSLSEKETFVACCMYINAITAEVHII